MSKLLKKIFYFIFTQYLHLLSHKNSVIKALMEIVYGLLDLWVTSPPKPHAFSLLPLQSGFNNSIKFSYYSFINSPYFYYYLRFLFLLVCLLSIHYNSDPIYCTDGWEEIDSLQSPVSRNIPRGDALYSVTRIRSGTACDDMGNPVRGWLYTMGYFKDGSVRGSMPFVHASCNHDVALTAFLQERTRAQWHTAAIMAQSPR